MKRLEEIKNYIDQSINESINVNAKIALEKLKPKRSFLDKLKSKDISYEEYSNILKKIIDILHQELIKKYPFIKYEDKSLASELAKSLITFYNFHYSTHFIKDKAKIYPVSLDEKTARSIYENELRTIIHDHLSTGKNYEDLFREKIELYCERTDFYKKTLNKIEVKPYYGTPKFMYERALFINECLKRLPFKTENQDIIVEEMQKFLEKYPETTSDISHKCYPYFDRTYKIDYEKFEEKYINLLNYENSLLPYIAKIWQAYLTNPNNHDNSSFKYIIHTFSSGLVPPHEMTKACCSLASERLLTTPYGNCGLIYDFTPESIETMCYEDAGSWLISKKEFIDRNLPLTWQLTNNNTFFENPKISKLILPSEIEKYGVANNLMHNDELLNYTTYQAYTEIFLNSKAKPIGVFYTDNCQNLEEVKEYARKYNLPLVHLSLEQLRTQAGLNPIPTKIETNKEANNTLHY